MTTSVNLLAAGLTGAHTTASVAVAGLSDGHLREQTRAAVHACTYAESEPARGLAGRVLLGLLVETRQRAAGG